MAKKSAYFHTACYHPAGTPELSIIMYRLRTHPARKLIRSEALWLACSIVAGPQDAQQCLVTAQRMEAILDKLPSPVILAD